MDAVRLVDLFGTGVAGILFTAPPRHSREQYWFLEIALGQKPYLLHEIDNKMGALTRVDYAPSTRYLLEDSKKPATRWKTTLPSVVQVVAAVEVVDALSKGKLTTEYRYHHGYWDGGEREFRGFGRVEQRDTEVFDQYAGEGLHAGAPVEQVPYVAFSPPTETRSWFHLGPVGPERGDWKELDLSIEYWSGDQPALVRSLETRVVLEGLERRARRDAVRAFRGSLLRTELYAVDTTPRRELPYTVTEQLFGLREESAPTAAEIASGRKRIFFPHQLGARTTQWERGNDPMTRLQFVADYDPHGQPTRQTEIGVPRGRDYRVPAVTAEPYLAWHDVTTYAKRDEASFYMVDRASSSTRFELVNDGTMTAAALHASAVADTAETNVLAQTVHYYDGDAFEGEDFGVLGDRGALMRSEQLVLTEAILHDAYRTGEEVLDPPEVPPYLVPGQSPSWTSEYPQAFRDQLPALAGYVFHEASSTHVEGFFAQVARRKYDFQESPVVSDRGLVVVERDPLERDTAIDYDEFRLLPVGVTDAAGLVTAASYDYRLFQPLEVTDPNGNRTAFVYTPAGLLAKTAVMGKSTESVGDTLEAPGVLFTYDLFAFANDGEPVSVRTTRRLHHVHDTDVPEPERHETIETVEYSDGFGRLLQTRTQAEDVIFFTSSATEPFGDAGLSADQEALVGDAVGADVGTGTRVVVSGSQVYDNKGRVVEKFEPFFALGWDVGAPSEAETGKSVRMFYDPRGQVIRTVNPSGSERLIIYGCPGDLSDPSSFSPTPWEVFTYDENDNAGRTHTSEAAGYDEHWDTPASALLDALGRTAETIARNGHDPDTETGDWYLTRTEYDLRGNVLAVVDPMGRVAARQVYDLANRPLRVESIDAGVRRSIVDAAGQPVEGRDKKGALRLHGSDVLGRPIRLWARDATGEDTTLRGHMIYGDGADSGLTETEAADANLLGKPYRQYDEAGRVEIEAYDFKGNALEKIRRTISDDEILTAFDGASSNNWDIDAYRVDWQPPPSTTLDDHAAALLEATEYRTSTTYNAVSRIKMLTYPEDADAERKELVPTYNRAGALERVELDGTTYVERIAYNAKGQRLLVAFGNGVMTRHVYDTETFRLQRLRSEKYTVSGLTYEPTGAAPLQDFAYEYDLVGNILEIHERVPDCGVANTPDEDALDRVFTYDPIYRLLSATGREHAAPPPAEPWDPSPRSSDPTLTRAYTQSFTYDRVGNLTQLDHDAGTGSFTRDYELVTGTNRLLKMVIGLDDFDATYDDAGNMTSETTGRHFEWDHSDRMRVYRTQTTGSEPSVHAHYLYDAGGQRVKKLVRKQGGQLEITINVDGVLDHHRKMVGATIEENDTLHVMDSTSRIATLRVGTAFSGDATETLKYQLGDHLGSSHVIASDDGDVMNREEYTPYGETSFGSFERKRYRYTGKERDEESGLYYHGARYYPPWLGRWASADPLGLVNGPNVYVYVSCNPLRLVDPTGTQDEEAEGSLVDMVTPGWQSPAEPEAGEEDLNNLVGRPIMQEIVAESSAKADAEQARRLEEKGPEGAFEKAFFNALVRFATGYVQHASPDAPDMRIYQDTRPGDEALADVVVTGLFSALEYTAPAAAGRLIYPGVRATSIGTAPAFSEANGVLAYRGINIGHPGYENALRGIVKPNRPWWKFWETPASAYEHNVEAGATLRSPYTSWSLDPEVAENYALRPPGNATNPQHEGVVLTKRVNPSELYLSPDTKQVQLIQDLWRRPSADPFRRPADRYARAAGAAG